MLKKILLASALVAACSTAAIASTGPYVGGSIGFGGYQSQRGATVAAFGGYGWNLGATERFYLGSELDVNLSYYNSYNTTYGFGMSVLPGVLVTKDTLIFLRGGLHSNYPTHKYGYNNYGSHYGVGVQTAVAAKWDVRGEYTRMNTPNSGIFSIGLIYKLS